MSKARNLASLFTASTDMSTDAEVTAAILTAVPSQSGNSGKYLTTNGSNTSWQSVDTGLDEFLNMGA